MTLPLQRSRETVELDVDLDFEPQCDYGHTGPVRLWFGEPCERPAHWVATRTCCTRVAIRCWSHLSPPPTTEVICVECRAVLPATDIWSRIEPLR